MRSTFRTLVLGILVAFLTLGVVTTASADDIIVKYDDFSDVSQLQINGNAYQNGNNLRLTDNAGYQHGSVFLKDKISIGSNSFSTYFTFQITNPVNGGADGFVFVIQPNSNTQGSAGGGMGYSGIANSIGIEFDTYNNGEISNSHVGIDISGSTTSVNSTNLEDSLSLKTTTIKHAWVDYDSETNVLEVRINTTSTRPSSPQLIHNFGAQTLRDIIGHDEAYVGFTAATGGAANDHDILSWYFSNTVDQTTTRTEEIPEFPTIALPVIAVLGLAFFFQRRN